MSNYPSKTGGQVRVFDVDLRWLNREAKKRHTIVAVIINELIGNEKIMQAEQAVGAASFTE